MESVLADGKKMFELPLEQKMGFKVRSRPPRVVVNFYHLIE